MFPKVISVSIVFEDQNLDESHLWSDKSVEELRIIYWEQIKKHLPRFLNFQPRYSQGEEFEVNDDSRYFCPLLKIALAYKKYGSVKLLYVSDKVKADLIGKTIYWLSSQI
ncbi:hypothetical protein [Geminocystis sp. GBBB08]|uniref:hypothetical protein n=1 Tax=Geminocystis sp. GBBB08 TaxID=2604140 RepID=UPI0027E3190B|nr:hypothetical protein [Geminocystis sp. GBBB08]MBL1208273.1 hypothetical protein [Geminocystis sp. GBBB08]